jgi:hypothetical protein
MSGLTRPSTRTPRAEPDVLVFSSTAPAGRAVRIILETFLGDADGRTPRANQVFESQGEHPFEALGALAGEITHQVIRPRVYPQRQ